MPPRSWFNNPAHTVVVQALRAARTQAGISQRELAARLSTEQTTIARIENGDRVVSLHEYVAICRALSVDPIAAYAEVLRQLPDQIEM